MKNLVLIIIFLLSNFCLKSELNWVQLTPNTINIYDIFIDKNDKMYVAVDGGYSGFLISEELGYDWQYKNNGLDKIGVSSLSLNDTVLYAGTFGYGVFRSTNYGEKWEPINNGLKSDTTDGSIMSLDSRGSNLYVGTVGRGILISTNFGESWQPKNEGLPIVGIVMDIALLDSTIFIGLSDGVISYGFYKSTDNGESWISSNNGIENPTKTGINEFIVYNKTIYAASTNGIFISTDGGNNWIDKSNGISNIRILSLAVNDKYLFAGTSNSQIYMSIDNGDSWKLIFDGITNGRIQTLALSKDYLFAGTTYVKSGKWGIFRAKLSDIETSVEDTPEKSGQLIYPNPASDHITIQTSEILETSEVSKVQIFNTLGIEVAQTPPSVITGQTKASDLLRIDISHLPTGVYFVRIIGSNGACSIVEKFVKM